MADDREQGLRLFSVDHPEHAGAIRTVLEGSYGGDISPMRNAFLDARSAIQSTTGVSYVLEDAAEAADRPGDLHVEHDDRTPLPAGETTA